ncbi:hypothetical protein [Leptospira jelokensis]|uniref:hypothetical protein n=1 Tax=Leptospira jelokensis TaxID=2484931 RepID=UPI0010917680|nr:hypothetical protein [Leptospira jelokensis]TGM00163.1 hypothetical protein EHQ79_14050 [Leptospira jelokensis]
MIRTIFILLFSFCLNLLAAPNTEIKNIKEIPHFNFTETHLEYCQNLKVKLKKSSIQDVDFWKEFHSEKCLPKSKIIHIKDICYLELDGSKDEVAFFMKIICHQNKGKKNQKTIELMPIMTVTEFEPSERNETEFETDPEYKEFRTKYAIGNLLLKLKKNAKFEAEILKLEKDSDLMFYTILKVEPLKK